MDMFESNKELSKTGAHALMMRDLITAKVGDKIPEWASLTDYDRLMLVDNAFHRLARRRLVKTGGDKQWLPKRIERVSRKYGETWYAPVKPPIVKPSRARLSSL